MVNICFNILYFASVPQSKASVWTPCFREWESRSAETRASRGTITRKGKDSVLEGFCSAQRKSGNASLLFPPQWGLLQWSEGGSISFYMCFYFYVHYLPFALLDRSMGKGEVLPLKLPSVRTNESYLYFLSRVMSKIFVYDRCRIAKIRFLALLFSLPPWRNMIISL